MAGTQNRTQESNLAQESTLSYTIKPTLDEKQPHIIYDRIESIGKYNRLEDKSLV